MIRQEKIDAVKQLKDSFDRAQVVIFADYKGVTSNEMTNLRASMRADGVSIKVVKNNLVRVALKGTNKEVAVADLNGPTAVIFSYNDPAATAKAVTKFGKDVEAFSIKEGLLGDVRISKAQIQQLASLPSKEVLVGQLLSVLNGPIRSFVCVLNAVPQGFVRALNAIAEKKGSQN